MSGKAAELALFVLHSVKENVDVSEGSFMRTVIERGVREFLRHEDKCTCKHIAYALGSIPAVAHVPDPPCSVHGVRKTGAYHTRD